MIPNKIYKKILSFGSLFKENKDFIILKSKDGYKYFNSKKYHFVFNKKMNIFDHWGKNIQSIPSFSPFGPEILNVELSKNNSSLNCLDFINIFNSVNENENISFVNLYVDNIINDNILNILKFLHNKDVFVNLEIDNISLDELNQISPFINKITIFPNELLLSYLDNLNIMVDLKYSIENNLSFLINLIQNKNVSFNKLIIHTFNKNNNNIDDVNNFLNFLLFNNINVCFNCSDVKKFIKSYHINKDIKNYFIDNLSFNNNQIFSLNVNPNGQFFIYKNNQIVFLNNYDWFNDDIVKLRNYFSKKLKYKN